MAIAVNSCRKLNFQTLIIKTHKINNLSIKLRCVYPGGRADAYRAKYHNKIRYIIKIIQEVLEDFLSIPKYFLVVLLKRQFSIVEKIKIFSILLLIKFAFNGEKMRVMMGGISRN